MLEANVDDVPVKGNKMDDSSDVGKKDDSSDAKIHVKYKVPEDKQEERVFEFKMKFSHLLASTEVPHSTIDSLMQRYVASCVSRLIRYSISNSNTKSNSLSAVLN